MRKDRNVVRVAHTVHSGNSHNQVKFKTSTGVVEVMVSIPDAT